MPYIVYILRCKDSTLYTGITNDLEKRLAAHCDGTGAKYTRSHPPDKVVHTEKFRSKGKALSRELAIKRLSRQKKIALFAPSKRV